MELKINLETALTRASYGLKRKMKKSIDLLRKSERLAMKYDSENGFWLAFSCGKDSQALYHIAQLAEVKFKGHFSPTSIDPPQVIRFCKVQYPEIDIISPKRSIYDAAIEHGCLPTMKIRWCCAEFKEGHGAGKVVLTGIRRSESVKRSKRNAVEISGRKFSGDLEGFTDYQERAIKRKYKHLNQDQYSEAKESEVRCISGKDKIIINPIIDWTEKDVWEFLNDVVKVPHCELYDPPYNRHRIGCILCPMSSYKDKIQDCIDYPHIKAKWLETIKLIRGGRIASKKVSGVWSGGDFTPPHIYYEWGEKLLPYMGETIHEKRNNQKEI